jgi:hypothetical protein
MNLNSHVLKLTGSAELPEGLAIGTHYAVGIEVAITDERKVDNEDGTFDLEYKARLIRAKVQKETGFVLTKDKSRQSTKTRYAILAIKNNYRPEMDDDSWYNLIQGGIRHDLPSIINNILK